jgi:hypothetical protein
MLGSTITLANLTTKCRSFTVKIDDNTFLESAEQMLSMFYREDLPFSPSGKVEAYNSHQHFFIEDPQTKELVRESEVTLEAFEDIAIVVVLQTPLLGKADILSKLAITSGHYNTVD